MHPHRQRQSSYRYQAQMSPYSANTNARVQGRALHYRPQQPHCRRHLNMTLMSVIIDYYDYQFSALSCYGWEEYCGSNCQSTAITLLG